MSKITKVKTGSFSKIPTQGGGREPIPDSSVGNNAIVDLAVTNSKIADTTIEEAKLSSTLQSKIVGDFVIKGFQDFVAPGELTAVDGAPAAGQFRSDIVNRSNISNLLTDLRPRMGINRIVTNQIETVVDEIGPSDEAVYRITNDDSDQVRLVGTWVSDNGTSGQRAATNGDITSYAEVVFNGTGLNILLFYGSSARDIRVSVDGAAYGSNVLPASPSGVLAARNYNVNAVIDLTGVLSSGLHTVRIRNNDSTDGLQLYGFEIINEVADLGIGPGDAFIDRRKIERTLTESIDFDGSFDNTFGTPGAKGGHVLTYLKSDGTIGKDIQYTDVTTTAPSAGGALATTDHSNEEVIREYHFREFGAGRTDDFSTLIASTSDRAFTLEDGTTSLMGDDVQATTVAGFDILFALGVADFFTFTWVGTGLDFRESDGVSTIDTMEFFIDDTSIGTTTTGVENGNIRKIVSGLPYGTHTCKMVRNVSSVGSVGLISFITYGPKETDLPSNAVKIADYFLMADFVVNTTTEIETVSTGVLRKNISREMVYTGSSWGITTVSPANSLTGHTFNNVIGDIMQYTFWGTGFDLRQFNVTGRTADVSVRLNGSDLTAANFGTATFTTHGCAYNSGTATLNCDSAASQGAGFITSGLPEALYTVEFENEQNSFFEVDSLDIITPIHSPKSNLRGSIQNALPIGSQGIADGRALTALKDEGASLPNWFKVIGVTTSPSTTSGSFVPLADMHGVIKTNGNPIKITFYGNLQNSVDTATIIGIFVDGILISPANRTRDVAARPESLSIGTIVPVSPGVHFIQIKFATGGGGTSSQPGLERILMAEEIK